LVLSTLSGAMGQSWIHFPLTSNCISSLNPDSSQIYTRLDASAPRLHCLGELPLKDMSSDYVGLRQPGSSDRLVVVSIVNLRLLLAGSRVRKCGGEGKLHNYLKSPFPEQALCVPFCVSHCFPIFSSYLACLFLSSPSKKLVQPSFQSLRDGDRTQRSSSRKWEWGSFGEGFLPPKQQWLHQRYISHERYQYGSRHRVEENPHSRQHLHLSRAFREDLLVASKCCQG
jgi:hypothetical protein